MSSGWTWNVTCCPGAGGLRPSARATTGFSPSARRTCSRARFRIFVHTSGLTRAERRQVAEVVVANHDWTYAIVTEAAAAGHQGFADHWRTMAEPAAWARRWCQRHQRALLGAAR